MNVIDAVKSGKPIRRASWNVDIVLLPVEGDRYILQEGKGRYENGSITMDKENILADDWEILEL